MKKLIGIMMVLMTFALGADVKPFVFENIVKDSATQQEEYNYMLKYKLFGRDYISIGNDVVIQDESGWNGTAGDMTSNARLSLGGPVLVNGDIKFGDQPTLTSGPVRGNTYTFGNQNGACINGIVCLNDISNSKINSCENRIYNTNTQICKDSVPESPKNLSIPTISWPDTISHSIIFDSQLNGDIKTIVVPDGKDQYDIYLDTIQFKLDHQKLQIEMQDGGRLTRIFVKHFLYHDHGQIQVVYRTDSTKYELTQNDYRGNVIIYTDESISIEHSDNSIMQGTMISTKEIYLACNINFAGQLLANQLRIGDTYNGKNFRFVKFDPDTIDVKLDKYGGLKENDSTVTIPIELSDTTDINVYFTYCVDLKDGVTTDDFNRPPYFPLCDKNESKKVLIPIGSKVPNIPIQINVKVDTLTEPNDVLVLNITDITGAILPNGKTDGELKIKIIDAPNSHVVFDTTATYNFDENKIGLVDNIKVLNMTDSTKFILDSAYTNRYKLDSTSGELTLVKYPLDYELNTIDTIKVILKDTGNISITRYIPINVNDVNESPILNDTTIILQENLPIPTIIGQLIAIDQDINTDFRQNIFELVEGDSNFTINKNGQLISNKIFDFEKDSTEYKLKVKVFDKNITTLEDSAIVTIKIGNINESPRFATEDTTFFIDENTKPTIIGNIAAIDEDNDKITYNIIENVPFKVDTNGNLSSTREFDYEKETIFTFKVVALSKENLTDTLRVKVVVNNVNEPCNVEDTTFAIKENSTGKLGNVNATDLDKDNKYGLLTYSISDTINYQIDKDGNIFVKFPFNFEENKKDSVKVYVTDGLNKDSAIVKINIIDVPEDIIISGKVEDVEENVEIGTIVGIIKGIDGDSTEVSYTINTTEFKINNNGIISTNSIIDYEVKKEYKVKVTAKSTDGSTKDTNLVIKVLNVNEPVHVNDTTFTVKENYTGNIGKVEGKDDDNEFVKYSVRNSNDYTIDSLGNISIITPLDYEKQKFDTLIVDVSTENNDKDRAIVIIKVKNVNETPILQPNDSLNVDENCKKCVIGIINAIDPDNDPIEYSVKEKGFSIDSNGVLTVINPLDYEKNKEVNVTIIAKDTNNASDTATYKVKINDKNEPVHTKDTTCSIKENYTGNVCKIIGTDEDNTKPKFSVSDTINYSIDSNGLLVIKKPIDYEKKTKDTVKVIITDNEFYDTAKVVINVIDEDDIPSITAIDDKPPVDTLKTNEKDHNIEYKICENKKCVYDSIDVEVHKDTTIKVCNVKKTKCDSVVILFNDSAPIVTLTNATSTNAYIDYITIEEQKDDKIYVNKKENKVKVTVKDTVHKIEQKFDINVKLDTISTKDIKLKDYNYLINENKSTSKTIGKNLVEMSEVVKTEDGTKITITKVVNTKTGKDVAAIQTVSYTKKVNDKDVIITYNIDNLTGQRIGDYEISYMIDSCTKVTYNVNEKKQIVKNKEGNIGYTITYDYIDEYGNKATSSVEIVYDDIPPKVEILTPFENEHFKTNAIPVKWTVNGETQDTLNLQRLEKGINLIIRRYVDKAGNVSADTVIVFMKEAKDIDISLVKPITEIDLEKVEEYYKENKYNKNKPYKIITIDEKDSIETIGIGFKVDIALPTINATGGLGTLNDLSQNNKIPVDDKGNIVGASNLSIDVKEYVENHCTDEFKKDYKKNGLNIPLYDVTYYLHLWVYTNNANYVNDFKIEYDINELNKVSDAGTVKMVIDWLTDKEGNVKAKNGHSLGNGAYIVNLISKSVAKHRCDFKDQKKGDKTVKSDETMKVFGYKRPSK